MTNKTAHDVTDEDRRLARDWAENIESDMDTWGDSIRAAVRVILNAVPTPERPTLADMTMEERHACRWMQADVDGLTRRWLILNPYDEDGDVEVVLESGRKEYLTPSRVTPRPDLPRMEWQGDKKPAPAPALPDGWRLADHQKYGRVMVTTPTPGSDGNVFFVLPSDGPLGYDWFFCTPAELTYIDQEADK